MQRYLTSLLEIRMVPCQPAPNLSVKLGSQTKRPKINKPGLFGVMGVSRQITAQQGWPRAGQEGGAVLGFSVNMQMSLT